MGDMFRALYLIKVKRIDYMAMWIIEKLCQIIKIPIT